MVLDSVDHLRAEHGVHEVGAEDRDDDAEEEAHHAEGEGEGDVAEEAAEEAGILEGEEAADGAGGELAAGVDEIMRAGDEAVEVGFECARGLVGAGRREIGGRLAVEKAEVAEVVGGEGLQAGGFGLGGELLETVPVWLAKFDPAVGEHDVR